MVYVGVAAMDKVMKWGFYETEFYEIEFYETAFNEIDLNQTLFDFTL